MTPEDRSDYRSTKFANIRKELDFKGRIIFVGSEKMSFERFVTSELSPKVITIRQLEAVYFFLKQLLSLSDDIFRRVSIDMDDVFKDIREVEAVNFELKSQCSDLRSEIEKLNIELRDLSVSRARIEERLKISDEKLSQHIEINKASKLDVGLESSNEKKPVKKIEGVSKEYL